MSIKHTKKGAFLTPEGNRFYYQSASEAIVASVLICEGWHVTRGPVLKYTLNGEKRTRRWFVDIACIPPGGGPVRLLEVKARKDLEDCVAHENALGVECNGALRGDLTRAKIEQYPYVEIVCTGKDDPDGWEKRFLEFKRQGVLPEEIPPEIDPEIRAQEKRKQEREQYHVHRVKRRKQMRESNKRLDNNKRRRDRRANETPEEKEKRRAAERGRYRRHRAKELPLEKLVRQERERSNFQHWQLANRGKKK